MRLKRNIIILIAVVLLLPLWMWLAWLFTPKKKLVAVIVDKTVQTVKGEEHVSFTWVLNNQRFTKTASSLYKNSNDYFGFFPMEDEKFRLKGLERFSPEMLDKLSNDADMVYFTDTYGIYRNEWYKKKKDVEGPGVIYGGMTEQDIELLRLMKAKHKLIISEFNTIGSPTPTNIRDDFENLFGMKWTGWIGRYFPSLDSAATFGLPSWLINNYKETHSGQWPFQNAGIAFVNTTGQLVIVEGKQLTEALPLIVVNPEIQKIYGLPSQINYTFWFDIMQADTLINKSIAEFSIRANPSGMLELMQHNIPASFPAILMHRNTDYRFYYFSGNFCDNPVSMASSYFKGVRGFKNLFYHAADITDRRQFFWNFYLPLMTHITNDYYHVLEKTNGANTSGK